MSTTRRDWAWGRLVLLVLAVLPIPLAWGATQAYDARATPTEVASVRHHSGDRTDQWGRQIHAFGLGQLQIPPNASWAGFASDYGAGRFHWRFFASPGANGVFEEGLGDDLMIRRANRDPWLLIRVLAAPCVGAWVAVLLWFAAFPLGSDAVVDGVLPTAAKHIDRATQILCSAAGPVGVGYLLYDTLDHHFHAKTWVPANLAAPSTFELARLVGTLSLAAGLASFYLYRERSALKKTPEDARPQGVAPRSLGL